MQLSSTLVFPVLLLASSPAFAAPTNSGSLNTAHKQDLQARTFCLFGVFGWCDSYPTTPSGTCPSSKSCPDSWVWRNTGCQATNAQAANNMNPKCRVAGHSWFSTVGYCSAPAYNAPDSKSCGSTHFLWDSGSLCCSNGGQGSAPAQPPAGKSCPAGNWFWDASNACCIPRNPSDCQASKPTCSTAGHVWDASSKCCKPPVVAPSPSSSSRSASSTAVSSSAAPSLSSVKPSSSSVAPPYSSAVIVSSTVIPSSSSSAPSPSVSPPTLCSGWTWYSAGMIAEGNGGRALASDTLEDNNMTPLMCSTYCASKGYALAGTEFSTQCFCGNAFSYGASATRFSIRSAMTCAGSSDICGGPDTLTMYYNSAFSSSSLVVTGTPPVLVAPVSSSASASASASGPAPTAVLYSGWASFSGGMIAEGNGGRALASDTLEDNGMTPLMCSTYCASKGYALAGTEFSTQCFCGNSFSNGASASVFSTARTMTCAGSSEICGGPDSLTIYYATAYCSSSLVVTITPPAPSATSAAPVATVAPAVVASGWATYTRGLVAEGKGGRALASDSLTVYNMTPLICTSYCASKGYALAGTEYSTQCFCGNSFSYGASATIFSAKSGMTCGGSSEICGGPDTLTIYYQTAYAGSDCSVTATPPQVASSTSIASSSSSSPAASPSPSPSSSSSPAASPSPSPSSSSSSAVASPSPSTSSDGCGPSEFMWSAKRRCCKSGGTQAPPTAPTQASCPRGWEWGSDSACCVPTTPEHANNGSPTCQQSGHAWFPDLFRCGTVNFPVTNFGSCSSQQSLWKFGSFSLCVTLGRPSAPSPPSGKSCPTSGYTWDADNQVCVPNTQSSCSSSTPNCGPGLVWSSSGLFCKAA